MQKATNNLVKQFTTGVTERACLFLCFVLTGYCSLLPTSHFTAIGILIPIYWPSASTGMLWTKARHIVNITFKVEHMIYVTQNTHRVLLLSCFVVVVLSVLTRFTCFIYPYSSEWLHCHWVSILVLTTGYNCHPISSQGLLISDRRNRFFLGDVWPYS